MEPGLSSRRIAPSGDCMVHQSVFNISWQTDICCRFYCIVRYTNLIKKITEFIIVDEISKSTLFDLYVSARRGNTAFFDLFIEENT